jgi:hypothetical protein
MSAAEKIVPMKRHPIPDAALDDRLAFIGASGSGKTYNAGTAVERLLSTGARVVIADPLGVWHGLRLKADGKAPAFPVVIFGGEHADLPLSEQHGALIGETAASMAESCIVDLSALGTKAAERRFMLGFLTALHRNANGEPVHLLFDEADMWAPQMLRDKEGDAAKLLGMMETIVRRGRIKGFIPWLITQRPAVLSKDVLSQADGLIAMKLTSAQDRAALGDWIEGQADRAEGKRILAEMPGLQRGQGVVWVPGRGVLETAQFPKKSTFDSSRTPTRGEAKRTVNLQALDLAKLKDRLAKVEADTKANDPRALKSEVARLQRELAAAQKHPAAAPPVDVAAIRTKAFEEAAEILRPEGEKRYAEGWADAIEATRSALAGVSEKMQLPPPTKQTKRIAPPPRAIAPPVTRSPAPHNIVGSKPRPPATPPEGITGPQAKVLQSLAWWAAMGHELPSRTQIAAIAGWSPASSNIRDRLTELGTAGLIDRPKPGHARLTPAGAALAPEPETGRSLIDGVRAILTGPQALVFDALLQTPDESTHRDQLAERVGWSPSSSNIRDRLTELARLEIIDRPEPGYVQLQQWVLS